MNYEDAAAKEASACLHRCGPSNRAGALSRHRSRKLCRPPSQAAFARTTVRKEGTPVSDLRLGVIGLGLRRSIATSAHHPGRGSAITAVCDLDPEVRRREAEAFATDVAVEDYKLLLDRDDLDAVVIATPDDTHEAIAIDALRALQGGLRGEAAGDHRRELRQRPACRVRDRDPAVRRPQHAAHGRRAADARHHRPRRHRGAQGRLGTPLRGLRRRLLLQGLARRPDPDHRSAPPEGRARHRRGALAGRMATRGASTRWATCSSTAACRAGRRTPRARTTGCASSTGRRRPARTCTTSSTSRTSR